MIARASMAAALMLLASVRVAPAQTPGRVEIAGGVQWFGAATFPAVNATQTAPGGARRVVFRTESVLDGSMGGGVRVGVSMTSILTLESTISLNATTLTTHARGDVEGAPETAASEAVTQYVFEGGALVRPARWRRGRLEPFVSAGAGYLRQLNDGHTLVETGSTWYGGGGVRYLLGAGGQSRAGVRLDVRATLLSGGVAVDDGRHLVPTVGGSVFFRF